MAENTKLHRTPLPNGWCERAKSAMVGFSLAQYATSARTSRTRSASKPWGGRRERARRRPPSPAAGRSAGGVVVMCVLGRTLLAIDWAAPDGGAFIPGV